MGVPGFPPPPITFPCKPPPQEREVQPKTTMPVRRDIFRMRGPRCNPTRQASGNKKSATETGVAAAVGAVVAMLKATVELPFPAGICGGLNMQLASGGRFEHEKLTAFGKVPEVGASPRLKVVAWPGGVDPLSGLMAIVKSKLCSGSAEKLTGAEWLIRARSVPVPTIAKLYAWETPLETVTLN